MNHRTNAVAVAALLSLAMGGGATPVRADVWDWADLTDEFHDSTRNELWHGVRQVHDLEQQPGSGFDEDAYAVWHEPRTSYEVLLDGASGDIDVGGACFYRYVEGSPTAQQGAPVSGHGRSLILRWINDGTATLVDQIVRVKGSCGCGTQCMGTHHQYTIRSLETTIGVARFNNAGDQRTVLLAQNGSAAPVQARAYFWSSAGVLLHTEEIALSAKGLRVLNAAAVPALAGQGGSITLAHDAPYGLLNVKAIAVEPATGFSFDSPGVYRGH